MKTEVSTPIVIAAIAIVVLVGGFLIYRHSVPTRPANAHTAAEGFRASVEKYRAEHPEAPQPNPQAMQRRLRLGSKDRKD